MQKSIIFEKCQLKAKNRFTATQHIENPPRRYLPILSKGGVDDSKAKRKHQHVEMQEKGKQKGASLGLREKETGTIK